MYRFIRWIQNWKNKCKDPLGIPKYIFCLLIFNDFLMSLWMNKFKIWWCNFSSLLFTPLGSGSVWTFLGSWIRIRIKTYADPKHCCKLSTISVKMDKTATGFWSKSRRRSRYKRVRLRLQPIPVPVKLSSWRLWLRNSHWCLQSIDYMAQASWINWRLPSQHSCLTCHSPVSHYLYSTGTGISKFRLYGRYRIQKSKLI